VVDDQRRDRRPGTVAGVDERVSRRAPTASRASVDEDLRGERIDVHRMESMLRA
jgi:hypothetical protein